MTVTAEALIETHGLNSTDLLRWRERGWITPLASPIRGGIHDQKRGAKSATRYPDWTVRMVALLVRERARSTHDDRHTRLLASVAAGLAAAPDCDWFVVLDHALDHAWPCVDVHQVRLALDYAQTTATIVAVP